MCGIVGIISNDSYAEQDNNIKKMMNSLIHRGPDASGKYINEKVALGHQRLSIIDIEQGQQPFFNDNKTLVMTYNGECYNYQELRQELEQKGCIFKTKSDTEVVLKLYEVYKEKAFLKINGMFALAIYNNVEKTLILARDRVGIKPLYYSFVNGVFLFASEIKGILAHSKVHKEVNHAGLNEYFSFQNIFSHQTLYKNILKLENGHYLKTKINDISLKATKYWDFNFDSSGWSLNKQDTQELLKTTFTKVVKRQMISDVPIGSYLSGGIDSGGITAVLASNVDRLATFTCGFDLSQVSGVELDFDERAKAEIISGKYFTKHHEIILNSKDLEWSIDDVIYHLDEPLLGMSYPNYYISELASKYVKVVFSGTGGDEIFAGYPWRYYHSANLGIGKKSYSKSYYDYWQRLISDQQKKDLFTPSVFKNIDIEQPFASFKNILNGNNVQSFNTESDLINQALYLESKTFLQGLLTLDDKLNMAHSVECRVPFLDNELVDLAMQIPTEYKIKDMKNLIQLDENKTRKGNYIESSNGKKILREALEGLLPKEIVEYKKQGFSAPDASWTKGHRVAFLNKIMNKNNPIFDLLDYKFVQNKVDEHLSGKVNNRLFIWSLFSLNSWVKNF